MLRWMGTRWNALQVLGIPRDYDQEKGLYIAMLLNSFKAHQVLPNFDRLRQAKGRLPQ